MLIVTRSSVISIHFYCSWNHNPHQYVPCWTIEKHTDSAKHISSNSSSCSSDCFSVNPHVPYPCSFPQIRYSLPGRCGVAEEVCRGRASQRALVKGRYIERINGGCKQLIDIPRCGEVSTSIDSLTRTQMVRTELAKTRPRAGKADITRQVEMIASTWLSGRSVKRGHINFSNGCATCQSDSLCHGQDQYRVLVVFTRRWTNKIKTETDHLQIRLCKHLTLRACPAHGKRQPLANRSGFWQEADSGRAIEIEWPRNIASFLHALSHTRP